MHKLPKFVAAAALAIAAATLSQPASAGLRMNGARFNGVTLQGISLNGAKFNGVTLQGPVLQGTRLHGTAAAATEWLSIELARVSVTLPKSPATR